MNKLPTYNLDPTANNPADKELDVMFLVPLLDRGFETSVLGCGCGKVNGCGSGTCLCGSGNGGGDGVCP
ncbi:MAG TPA: hypothetical protein VE980_15535 [Pyrinomonadaceae bacterium]|nr:hypothetical protein [Pyrinomonadaceae bacterium]